MQDQIDRFLETEAERWSERTVESYGWYLARMAKFLASQGVVDPGAVTPDHLRAWTSSHPRWGKSSRYLAICAARSFFGWLQGAENAAEKVRLPRREIRPMRTLNENEVEKFLAACDTSTAKGTRDTSIITLMLDTGLRVTEVCELALDMVEVADRTLSVKIKGGRWAQAVYGVYAARMLAEWLTYRGRFALTDVRTVYVGIGGLTPGSPMTRNGVRAIFYELSRRAGIKRVSPHALRRTFATLALKRGAPSRLVQIAGRWSSIDMVERYSQALTPEDFSGYFPMDRIMRLDDEDETP